jgi:preprotein translocase subunit SecE
MAKTNTPNKGKVVSGFFREVAEELKQVTWPKRKDTVRMTGIVIAITIAIGVYLGGLDYLYTYLMGLII